MRYSRVLLVRPGYPGSFYEYEIPTYPAGLGYIAESLKIAHIEYDVIDMSYDYRYGRLKTRIEGFNPDLIGISMMSSKYRHNYNMIKQIKSDFPNVNIVVGGPHISTLREKVLHDCVYIDYGITLEGEETIVELCQEKEIPAIKGLIFRENETIKYTGDRQFITNLDCIPFPTYEKFEKHDLQSMTIVTSRGCPYSCIYCPVPTTIGRKLRVRSPKNVVDEIEFWYIRRYRIFYIVDDNFTFYKERVYQICDEIESRNLKIELNCSNGIRADRVDKQLLTRMKEVGFRQIAFGVEAGNDRILRNLGKGEKIADIEKSIKDACDLGYEVELFFLIGSPGEGMSDIEDSFRMAKSYPIAEVRFYNLIPFPGTKLYEWVDGNGYFVRSVDEYLNGIMHWENEPIFYTPQLSIEERKRVFKRGKKLSQKLSKRHRYNYYKQNMRRLGILATVIAFIASRTIIRKRLRKSLLLKGIRHALKKYKIWNRQIQ